VFSKGEGHGTTFTLRHPMTTDSRRDVSVMGRSFRASVNERSQRESRASFISVGDDVNNPVSSISPATDIPSLDNQSLEPVNEEMLCILVVDDAPSNRKMLCRMIEDPLKCHCDEAVDGKKAVELIKQSIWIPELDPDTTDTDAVVPFSSEETCRRPYDAVLMDYTMPNMSGPDAAKVMRELGYKGLIVGITGHSDESAQNAFIASGADRVFTKPVERAVLIALLKMLRTNSR